MTTGPKTARGLTTMNRIIKAAETEFGRKGYYNTGINDIATRAKVASGTIYLYFDDKYSLYVHLLTQYGHRIRKEIAKSTEKCATRHELEREGLLAFLRLVKKRPHMYNIIWESLYIDPKLFAEYYETFASRYKHQLDMAQGEVTQMDTTVMAYCLMGISNFLGLKYVFFDKDADLEYVVDEALKFLSLGALNGHLPPPPAQAKKEDTES